MIWLLFSYVMYALSAAMFMILISGHVYLFFIANPYDAMGRLSLLIALWGGAFPLSILFGYMGNSCMRRDMGEEDFFVHLMLGTHTYPRMIKKRALESRLKIVTELEDGYDLAD